MEIRHPILPIVGIIVGLLPFSLVIPNCKESLPSQLLMRLTAHNDALFIGIVWLIFLLGAALVFFNQFDQPQARHKARLLIGLKSGLMAIPIAIFLYIGLAFVSVARCGVL